MALTDAPDKVIWTQPVNVVDGTLTPSEPANEVAAGAAGRYSGSDTSYQEVASWTVSTGKVGELKEITILSNEYDYTHFQITIGSTVYKTDWLVQAAMPLIFEDLKLAAGTEVKVECKSTDGEAIVVDAVIVGKEIG